MNSHRIMAAFSAAEKITIYCQGHFFGHWEAVVGAPHASEPIRLLLQTEIHPEFRRGNVRGMTSSSCGSFGHCPRRRLWDNDGHDVA